MPTVSPPGFALLDPLPIGKAGKAAMPVVVAMAAMAPSTVLESYCFGTESNSVDVLEQVGRVVSVLFGYAA